MAVKRLDRYARVEHDTDYARATRELRTVFRNRRLELNLTQRELAKYAGLGVGAVEFFEGGRMPPHLPSLMAMCVALHLEIKLVPKVEDACEAVEE